MKIRDCTQLKEGNKVSYKQQDQDRVSILSRDSLRLEGRVRLLRS
jgi:hypothetical protein